MAQSLSHLILHAVFSTKARRALLRSEEFSYRGELRELLKRHRVAFDERFSLGIMPGTRPPFQRDAFGDLFPGLKPMGCSVFALWAMQNAQTPCPFGA